MGTVISIKLRVESVYWSDISTGDWEADCQAGRDRADTLIRSLAETDGNTAALFTRTMRDMMTKGVFSGVEVGFFQRVLEYAVTGLTLDASR
jgi:hypothetical protein